MTELTIRIGPITITDRYYGIALHVPEAIAAPIREAFAADRTMTQRGSPDWWWHDSLPRDPDCPHRPVSIIVTDKPDAQAST
jgi:hypothetical protein